MGVSGVVEVVEFLDIFPIWKNFHLAFSPLRFCGAGRWTCSGGSCSHGTFGGTLAVVGFAVVGVEVVGLNAGLPVGHACSYGAGRGTFSCGTFGCGTCSHGAGHWTCSGVTCNWVVGLAVVGVSGVVEFLDIFLIPS